MEESTKSGVKEDEDTAISSGECLPDFVDRDWDEDAEIPIPHFNFLIQLLLPRHQVSKIPEREQNVVRNINAKQFSTYGDNPNIKCVAVGSSAEAYMLPSVIHKVPGLQVHLYSDMDVLLEWQLSPLEELSEISVKQRMSFNWKETHPGYARIHVNREMFGNADSSFFVDLNKKYFLSAKKQREDRFHDLESEILADNRGYIADSKGPAVAIEDSSKLTAEFLRSLEQLQIRQELVTAIPCQWPSNAENWKNRPRKNNWLSPDLIDSLVTQGCHLVPVAHKHSKNPDVEWRISFATTEVTLANKVISTEMRQCYIYLKLLRQIMMKDKILISSYHCKTVFLYSCETLPLEAWGDNPGLCVLYLLDRLLYYVRRRFLPSYFIPENNLIDHFTEDDFVVCESILLAARMDPIGQILEFTDSHVIANQTVSDSFRELIIKVVDDMKDYKLHKNIGKSMGSFMDAFLKVIYANMIENKISAAVSYSLDMSRFFMRYYPGDDICYYLFCVFVDIKSTMQLINVFENILSCAEEYPAVLRLRGHLATLYHCALFSFESGSPRYEEIVQKSEALFNRFFEENGNKSHVTVNYASFLMSTGNSKRAIEVLQQFFTLDKDLISFKNNFNTVTCISLEPSLRSEIQHLFQKAVTIQIPSGPLACYIYLKCLKNEKIVQDEEQVITEFENACKASSNSWSYFLLGLSLMDLEKYEAAETAFLGSAKLLPKLQLNLQTKIHICRVQKLLHSGQVREAVQYLVEIAQKFYPHIPLAKYLNYIALNLTKLKYTVDIFEEIMILAEEHPDINELRGNMACIYHAYAYEYQEDSDEYLTALVQADTLFHAHITAGLGGKLSSKVDYAMFLLSQGRWDDVEELLGNPLDLDTSCTDSNSYGVLEINRLDENLRSDINVHGEFEAPAVAFCFYLCTKYSLKLGKPRTELKTVIEHFLSYCDSMKHARSYALLGYAYIMMGQYMEAERSFCKAVINCHTYSVAKQNIDYCRAKAQESGQTKLDVRGLVVALCLIPELEGDYNLDFEGMFK